MPVPKLKGKKARPALKRKGRESRCLDDRRRRGRSRCLRSLKLSDQPSQLRTLPSPTFANSTFTNSEVLLRFLSSGKSSEVYNPFATVLALNLDMPRGSCLEDRKPLALRLPLHLKASSAERS